MNFAMWKKALTVIPNVTKEEWDKLDIISKWLISTRAAVLLMTLLSAVLAGLFAWHDGYKVNLLSWFILALGLVLAHASNNIFNDYTDYTRGVDKDNYYRTMYGPQPVADGLMTRRQHLTYFAVTAFLALLCGLYLIFTNGNDLTIWVLLGLGAFFVLFYTWPLKYIAMGEIAVLIVWGPLMIGGGYYVLTHVWNWNVVWASLPYVLGVTTVIFGKHIDKLLVDKAKKIFTLPVLIGEKVARYIHTGHDGPAVCTGIVFDPDRLLHTGDGFGCPGCSNLPEALPAVPEAQAGDTPRRFPGRTGRLAALFCPASFH